MALMVLQYPSWTQFLSLFVISWNPVLLLLLALSHLFFPLTTLLLLPSHQILLSKEDLENELPLCCTQVEVEQTLLFRFLSRTDFSPKDEVVFAVCLSLWFISLSFKKPFKSLQYLFNLEVIVIIVMMITTKSCFYLEKSIAETASKQCIACSEGDCD